LAYARIDGIGHAVLAQQLFHHLTRGHDLLPSAIRQRYRPPLIYHLAQVIEGKIIATDLKNSDRKRIHEFCWFRLKAFIYFSGSGRRSNLSSTMMCTVSPVASSVPSLSRNTS